MGNHGSDAGVERPKRIAARDARGREIILHSRAAWWTFIAGLIGIGLLTLLAG